MGGTTNCVPASENFSVKSLSCDYPSVVEIGFLVFPKNVFLILSQKVETNSNSNADNPKSKQTKNKTQTHCSSHQSQKAWKPSMWHITIYKGFRQFYITCFQRVAWHVPQHSTDCSPQMSMRKWCCDFRQEIQLFAWTANIT